MHAFYIGIREVLNTDNSHVCDAEINQYLEFFGIPESRLSHWNNGGSQLTKIRSFYSNFIFFKAMCQALHWPIFSLNLLIK